MFKPILRNILLLGILIIALSSVSDVFRVPQLTEGFADQRLHTIDGRELTLAELSAKKPLLVYFWSRWCNLCHHTLPTVLALSNDGINVLTVALRSGDDISVVRYLHGKHLTMPVVNDPQGEIATRWNVSVTPTWLIISDGKVVLGTTGWSSPWGIQLRLWWVQKWYQ
ncbi:protein disulfide oxidoreductase [Erwinia endophytica]|uniref:protein disulfide oxidoreductase n=1 Tax=Erwinia endophytica TaxID=1563158 RepID=UPI001265DA15|nr:protein disulfide oxidoreductase [Erwinia endophytica]KAB8306352.1 protein disulfide oxidoreductase [Erwinia endophytica]